MQRMIPVDKLARPEDHILLPANRTRNARSEQGLSPGNAMPYEDDFLKSRMHGICGGEFQAMEAAGRTLYDFPDAPWEFQLDMARQVWDESRHAEIYMKLLEYVGSYYGEFPEGEVLWSCTQADDPACASRGNQSRARRACVRRLRTTHSDRAENGRHDYRTIGRLRTGRRDHSRADGIASGCAS